MGYGSIARILRVNLTTGTLQAETALVSDQDEVELFPPLDGG